MLVAGERYGALKSIADLTAVPHWADGGTGLLLVGIQGLGVVQNISLVKVDQPTVGQLGEVSLPDALGVFPFQRRVVECHVETGLERLIKHAHSVTCKK